ncbi:OsmC family protein [Curvivirga aplysinae]|uniref:OsmC family protein n=1 Tax=Curvivirga aplysinae TaxID=2529852 RepID=UPI0012BC74C7|nr:OsmC family protein [Curvivirga aplysinae]MTI09799.1 OsmC family peroxiredoxin [Curvivirga aplysinae]
MSELSIEIEWERNEPTLTAQSSKEHKVVYNSDFELIADAASDWGGDPNNTNPEQALAAALSSCHMMTFLALSAKARWPVASYRDKAIAYLGKNSKGQMTVTQIDLHPIVRFDSGYTVSSDALAEMQQRAHRYCFIANTLAESVKVNIL